MEGSTGLSQGVFIDKPNPNKRKKIGGHDEIMLESLKCFSLPLETIQTRYKLYRKCLKRAQDNINDLEMRWNSALSDQVGLFIQSSIPMLTTNELVTPVGFVPSNMSQDENSLMFDEIENEVRNQGGTFLARVNSSKCPNVKMAFQNICKQLLHNNLNVSQFHEMTGMSEDLDETVIEEDHQPSRYLSVHDLQKWYETKCPVYFDNPLFRNSPSLGLLSASKNKLQQIPTTSSSKAQEKLETPLRERQTTPQPPQRQHSRARKSLNFVSENESPKSKSPKMVDYDNSTDDDEVMIIEKIDDDKIKEKDNQETPVKRSLSLHTSTPRSILKPSSGLRNAAVTDILSPVINLNRIEDSVNLTPKSAKSVRYLGTPKYTPVNRSSPFVTPRTGRQLDGIGRRNQIPQLIVLIFENADYFSQNVIPQILQLLSCSKLPVAFIFGVSHSLGNFGRFIPQNCNATFTYKTFKTTTASDKLNQSIYAILNDQNIPFKLSGNILSYLAYFFELQHFSVTRLLQAYEICLANHFRKPESIFCTSDSEIWEALSPEDLTASIGTHFKKETPERIKDYVKSCHTKMQKWMLALNILHYINKKLSVNSGISFQDLFSMCANGSFFEVVTQTNESCFDCLLNRIRSMQQPALNSLIEKLYNNFRENSEEDETEESVAVTDSNVAHFVSKLEDFKTRLTKVDEEEKLEVLKSPEQEELPKRRTRVKLPKTMTREALAKSLLDKIQEKDGSPAFLEIRKSFISYLEKIIKKDLKRLTSVDDSKIFVYDNLPQLKSMFSPNPQGKLVNDICAPGKILQCDCCQEIDFNSVQTSLPDSSIVFKLLKEQMHKKVDLNVLYEGFEASVEPPTKKRASIAKRNPENADALLLRFRQAVAELQHIGVLKRSKCKPDEVTKLVWL